MKNSIAIIQPQFYLEAVPPTISATLANIKGVLVQYHTKTFDLDAEYYYFAKRENSIYTKLQYLLGGVRFSYPLNSNFPTNLYPFETMPSAELITSIILDIDYSRALMKICDNLNFDYKESKDIIVKYLDFIGLTVKKLHDFQEIIIETKSISSVYSALIFAGAIKKENKRKKIFFVGKNFFIPEINELVKALHLCDVCLSDISKLQEKYTITDWNKLDFSDFDLSLYNTYLGLYNINLTTSIGCPHKCKFCSLRLQWDDKEIYQNYYNKKPDEIIYLVKQLKERFGICFVNFENCTFNAENDSKNQLLEKLKREGLLYCCNLRVDMLEEEDIQNLKKANFYKVILGVETLEPSTAQVLGKGFEGYTDIAKKNISLIKNYGIDVQINILLFYPGMTIEKTINDIERWKEYAMFLEKSGVLLSTAYIGTLCLNYPSIMYTDVLQSSHYQIICHKVTDEFKKNSAQNIVDILEKIPLHAVDTSQKKVDNKLLYVNRLYAIIDNNNTGNNVALMNVTLKIKENLLNHWVKNSSSAVIKNEQITSLKIYSNNNKEKVLIKYIVDSIKEKRKIYDIVLHGLHDKNKVFAMIVYLELLGYVKIKI